MAKSTENSTKSKRGNPQNLIPWKPGQSGNPKGYAKGQRHYKTIFREALKRIAQQQGCDPVDVEDAIHVKAIEKAIKGDFFFYKELNERVHGKVKEYMDVTSDGKSLADLIAFANVTRRGKETRKTTRKVSE